MAKTIINLDQQAKAKILPFGSTAANGQALVTLYNGTAALSNVVLQLKGSQTIDGDLNVVGNINLSGSVNQTNVNNLQVADINITLNKGGTTGGAAGAGILIEGTSGVVIGKMMYDNSLASKFSIGNGTTMVEIVDVSSTQTLTNKSIGGSQINGNISGFAANVTGVVAVANGGTGVSSTTAYGVLLGGTTSTGAFQNAGVGATGTILTSNGPGQAPTWQLAADPTVYFKAAVVSGTQDSINKVFTVGAAIKAGSEQVFKNGQLLTPGSTNDYVISGTTITFQSAMEAPEATDTIRVYGIY